MSERDCYPPGVPCRIDTARRDLEAAFAFYRALLGWDFTGPGAMPDLRGRYEAVRLRSKDVAGISSQPLEMPPAPARMTLAEFGLGGGG